MPLFPEARFDIVADDKTKRGVDSATKNLNRLRNSISLLGVAGVAATGIAALGALVVAGARSADEMAKAADKLGLSAEGLAGLRNAARLTGVETSKLDLGIQRMTRRIAEAAHGTGEAQGAIKELGLDAAHLAELAPDQQFREIAEAMKGIDRQSERVRLGFKLFDSEGVDLIRTLDLGASGLDAATKEAEHFGTSLSKVRSLEIEKAGDAVGRVKTAIGGLGIQLAGSFSTSIADAANATAEWIAYINSTAIPALRFMGERVAGIESNVKSLSLQELQVRAVALTDDIAALNKEIEKTGGKRTFGGQGQIPAFTVDLNAALRVAEAKLAKIQERIADIQNGSTIDDLVQINVSTLPQKRDTLGEGVRSALEEKSARTKEAAAAREEERAREQAQREADARANELEQVRTFLKSREELEADAYVRRAEIIVANMEAGEEREALLLENARQRAAYLVEIEKRKQEEINQAVLSGIHTREQFEKASLSTQVKGVLGTLTTITAGVATHDRRLFELNKAAAIGNAVINTAQGVTKALAAYPPPLSFVMAAAQATAGAAQIGAIRATSFGSGTTPSSVGSTPTLAGQPVPENSPTSTAPTAGPATNVNITINGDVLSEDRLKAVLGNIFGRDGVIITANSRQAAEIRGG